MESRIGPALKSDYLNFAGRHSMLQPLDWSFTAYIKEIWSKILSTFNNHWKILWELF